MAPFPLWLPASIDFGDHQNILVVEWQNFLMRLDVEAYAVVPGLHSLRQLKSPYNDEVWDTHVNDVGLSIWPPRYAGERASGKDHEPATQLIINLCADAEQRPQPYPAPVPPPPAPWPGALSVSGRRFVTPDGQPFRWLSVTGFRLLEQIAHGRESEAVAFLDWCASVDVHPRVLAMAWHLFRLHPDEGRLALPRLLELAKARGRSVNVCAWADTGSYPLDRATLQSHVAAMAASCVESGNAILELGNELDPVHETQWAGLGDVDWLRWVRASLPASVLVALGSAHGGSDESLRLAHGNWHGVHLDRSRDRWNRERRVRELLALGEATHRPIVNDEPIRRGGDAGADANPDAAFCQAVLTDLFQIAGDTFHYAGGRDARIPQGAALSCFEAWRAGHRIIPFDAPGRYYNSNVNGGWSESPVASHDVNRCVRAYSWAAEHEGWNVGVGCQGDGGIRLQHGWQIVSEHGRSLVRVLNIAR